MPWMNGRTDEWMDEWKITSKEEQSHMIALG